MDMVIDPADFIGARERWLAGLCPCCGAELDWWPSVEPQAVAEGVMMCGRCIENEHHTRPPEMLPALLLALLPLSAPSVPPAR